MKLSPSFAKSSMNIVSLEASFIETVALLETYSDNTADQEVFRFARKMLQIFSLALGLEETDLDDTFRYPLNDITMQYYPIQDPNDQSSISPHADYGGKKHFLLLTLTFTPPLLFNKSLFTGR